ncbi:hypothetical protein [Stagnihabitans tardus]|uniref:Uncharacterized protein n=1 Tax=Stagnihabitans tardus TaxID=2699202 RepID=A0AAE4Y9B4_9RHOB|nr:hypothetical protein [Stagnihabitans tardus]NBZ87639.1 hypothetical protein [Stagnihabitans tardus]
MTGQVLSLSPRRLGAALLVACTLALCGPASADALIDRFPTICGDTRLGFAERVDALTAAGWSRRNPGMWESYRPLLTEAFIATSIKAQASPDQWAETRAMADQLSGILAMSADDRAAAGIPDLTYAVLVSTGNPVAVLAILDEGMVLEGRVHCYYAGPLPTEIASFVAQMERSRFTEMNDNFVHQYSLETTENHEGVTQVSAQLVAILTPEAAQRLGAPPQAAAAVSIYSQPLLREGSAP